MPNTFDVIPKRKRLVVFKVGKLWLFKQFFENREVFEALLGHYNQAANHFFDVLQRIINCAEMPFYKIKYRG